MQIFRSQDMQRHAAAVMQEAAMVEPVIITYHDRPRLVLMPMREYGRLRGRGATRETELPPQAAESIKTLGSQYR
ncbi:MAG TPA: type II toxin-antitoxin system prevent-host-death family antitoxin [Acetobacteraceae bacterium]|jgi:prevent-host-death family protein|nr:type II toxin-antitoxin system prevent-host-death family antitoxin [Acetobacteraceae bacterium]